MGYEKIPQAVFESTASKNPPSCVPAYLPYQDGPCWYGYLELAVSDGHSDAGVTMNVYTHATYDHAEDITVTFAGRGAQVGLTLGHNAYTIFLGSYVKLHQFTKSELNKIVRRSIL